MDIGFEEGEKCNRGLCKGIIHLHDVENCACHISPPCGACTEPREYCPECGWEHADDPTYIASINDYKVHVGKSDGNFRSWKPRELDPTKLDYRSKSHTNSSMIKEGVYPEGMTKKQVEEKVQGTFGGRFESFGNGRFKYIAYTD